VGRDPGEHQLALLERLGDEPDVELLQVAQSAVEELARTAGRAAGEVASLDKRGVEPAGHRVEGGAGAGHAATDDEDVEDSLAEAGPGTRPLLRAQLPASRHNCRSCHISPRCHGPVALAGTRSTY
jgi:hypothetical protein